ncbi:MAG: hypothetical protein HQL64_16140 [Magnetococcales bacterium]|nr:hypothetical protein [Magnetococcales bacterium]
MSGTPKYSKAQLNEARQRALEADRRRRAREEEQKRQMIERQEQQHRLEAGPKRLATRAEQAVAILAAWHVALQQDPVLMRWVPQQVLELERLPREAEQALLDRRFNLPPPLLEQARQEEQRLVALANAAQLKAEQRDAIAHSMLATLQAMGFVTSEPGEEHPGHPATALVLKAEKASGHGVSISVPLEGDVWYEMQGYPCGSEREVTGETSAVCDAAEMVLNEMRERLATTCGVEVDEIQWEGKNSRRSGYHRQGLPVAHPVTGTRDRS